MMSVPPLFRQAWHMGVTPICLGFLVLGGLVPCAAAGFFSNNPYPWDVDQDERVLYASFVEAPKNLDPQKAYTTWDGLVVSLAYESLLSYDYLERPLKLTPQLATAIPKAEVLTDSEGNFAGTRYRFTIQQGVLFADDPCFPSGRGREVTASDFVYAFQRLADPKTNCPVADSFGHIKGFRAYRETLKNMEDAERKRLSVNVGSFAFYQSLGKIEGVVQTGRYSFDLVLEDEYPQMLYWLAMRFIAAIPHEAVDRYDGSLQLTTRQGSNDFNHRPVGTGPFQPYWEDYRRDQRMVMVKNPTWWGLMYPERKAPGTMYPMKPGSTNDVANLVWVPERAGEQLPAYDRIEWFPDKEQLPRFNKFLQGYYDRNFIPQENFSSVVSSGSRLSPGMAKRDMRLLEDISMDVRYIGFNMQDDKVGHPLKFKDPRKEANREVELERNRKVRKAMSLAVDSEGLLRIFFNGLGVPAQFMLPPGIFGYEAEYENPYRQYDKELTEARKLLEEAGYPNGVNAETGERLAIDFISGRTDPRNKMIANFYVEGWQALGIDVTLSATEYNTFQEKMYEGRFQVFPWGWILDYPDPENFLFLLYGPNSGKYNPHAPNHTWYENPEYDYFFKKMETLTNVGSIDVATTNSTGVAETVTMSRMDLIRKLRAISEEDCAWIPLYHSAEYIMAQPWTDSIQPHPITGPWYKYYGMDKEKRDTLRKEWNPPIRWPMFLVPVLLVALILPGARVVLRERR